jgi:DNA-binding NarL/FixJ family response regulator
MTMTCAICHAESYVLAGRRRIRECMRGHRWPTEVKETRVGPVTEPATRESVLRLRQQGASIRRIGEALLMSTATVQRHLASVPSLEKVWR